MKTRLSFVILILSQILCTNSKADVYGGTRGTKVINTIEGGYAVLGRDSLNLYVVKIDFSGVMLWNKTFNFPSYNQFFDIVQTPDSGFVLAGVINDTSIHISQASIIKLSNIGDSLWTYSYLLGEYGSYGKTINVNHDGNLVFGISSDDEGPDNPASMNLIDQAGLIINGGQIAPSDDWTSLPESNRTSNGNYINALNTLYGSGYTISLTDSLGNNIWNIFKDSTIRLSAISPCLADSGFYIAGQWSVSAQSFFSILKIDVAGNILWEHLTNMNISLSKIVQFQDGFAGIGSGVLYRFNNMGDTLWSRAIPGMYNFDTIPQGGFIFTGDSIGQLWISVTDTSGIQLRFGTVDVNHISQIKSDISFYPNPNSDIININFHSSKVSNILIEICDERGRVIKQIGKSEYILQNNICRINLNSFINETGNYILRILEGGKRVHSEKILFIGK